jgi:hypothetical protein
MALPSACGAFYFSDIDAMSLVRKPVWEDYVELGSRSISTHGADADQL